MCNLGSIETFRMTSYDQKNKSPKYQLLIHHLIGNLTLVIVRNKSNPQKSIVQKLLCLDQSHVVRSI